VDDEFLSVKEIMQTAQLFQEIKKRPFRGFPERK
jgi:hypothetical protein